MDPRSTFPRSRRLVRAKDFARTFASGGRARGDVLLVVCATSDLSHPRLGLSVGRKIWKSAVRRNRLRRLFREAFRLEQHALPPGADLILIAARPKLWPSLGEVRSDLRRLAPKAHQRALERLASRAEEGA